MITDIIGSFLFSEYYGGAILVALGFGLLALYFKSKKKPQLQPPVSEVQKEKISEQKSAELIEKNVATLSEHQRVNRGLSKTKTLLQKALDRVFTGAQGEQFYSEVEEALLTSDVGLHLTEKVIEGLRESYGVKLPVRSELKEKLHQILVSQLQNGTGATSIALNSECIKKPHVIMVVGINGAGKTTTIAKLSSRFIAQGKKVLVGAADTFRAAATEQLKTWVERVGAEGVFQKEGSDPSAVAFDTTQAAVSRGFDVCIIDTAGRLHTKSNLMDELKKMRRVVDKALPGAPHEVWLVVDGTNGQNAINQAKEFHTALNLTGVIVTKLDGSAKGGAVLSIYSELKVPVVFIGVGESQEDLIAFKSEEFVQSLLEDLD